MTRAKQATELASLLRNGPSLTITGNGINKQELAAIENEVQLWLDTHVAPLCQNLIPELRGRK